MDIKTNIEDTIFSDYDTVVFDMDGTILDCFTKQGDAIGVYQTNPPYKLTTSTMLVDTDGNVVRLEPGIRDLFKWLDKNSINIGIVSSGEKEDTTFEGQPGVLVLRKFDLKRFINYEIVFKHDINKGNYVKPLGKTLFIDNKDENLDDVDKKGQVDVLNRGSFENWEDLLQRKTAILNLNLFRLVNYGEKDPINAALRFYQDTLDYSKLKLKVDSGRFITPKESTKLSALQQGLPVKMSALINTLQSHWKDTGLNEIRDHVWNEDNWPRCFQKIDNAIDIAGI